MPNTMLPTEIARQRMRNQLLFQNDKSSIAATVRHLGVMQAQDYPMSKWAVGTRLPGATEEALESALEQAQILRTHLLRPTWHLVAAEDLRWMLRISRPQIKSALRTMDAKMGIDETLIAKSQRLIAQNLEGGRERSRTQLMDTLRQEGIPVNSLMAVHIMMHAEVDALVCNGSLRGKDSTYALVDERIPPEKYACKKEECLAELARRYFSSHGPATLGDFHWWSGLKISDARIALESVKFLLKSEQAGNDVYWYNPNQALSTPQESGLHLLPAFDEFLVSYKDRSAALDPTYNSEVITVNGIFKPVVVENASVIGAWKRSMKKDKVLIEPLIWKGDRSFQQAPLQKAAARYGRFHGLNVVFKDGQ